MQNNILLRKYVAKNVWITQRNILSGTLKKLADEKGVESPLKGEKLVLSWLWHLLCAFIYWLVAFKLNLNVSKKENQSRRNQTWRKQCLLNHLTSPVLNQYYTYNAEWSIHFLKYETSNSSHLCLSLYSSNAYASN